MESEIHGHAQQNISDHDLAYCADLAIRLRNIKWFDGDPALITKCDTLLSKAAELYPAIAIHMPTLESFPDVTGITEQIDAATPPVEEMEEDIPS